MSRVMLCADAAAVCCSVQVITIVPSTGIITLAVMSAAGDCVNWRVDESGNVIAVASLRVHLLGPKYALFGSKSIKLVKFVGVNDMFIGS